jgi:hypothetical protein
MKEIKNAFIQSKMNKDLDDRLLPSGQYRHAVNIAVSKSEGSDVGALENVLGNKNIFEITSILPSSYADCQVIGFLASEINNTVFVFLTNNINDQYPYLADNAIVSYNLSQKTAKIHVKGAFLNFSTTNPIYGINLLEDLLFWTDNRNQPRKININQESGYYTQEHQISVAKYYPYKVIDLYEESATTPGEYKTTLQDAVNEFLPDGTTNNPDYDADYEGDPDYLEDKFLRFSYRFKFDDGEYSLFAPFTQDCFIPKQDGYFLEDDEDQALRGSIVGFMENKVNKILLNIPLPSSNVYDDYKIRAIDILYKESDGVSVKVMETIPINSGYSNSSYLYTYKGTKPYKTLPEKELIRVYDKIPVKAFSQEIISNRVVYGNFLDKHSAPIALDYNVGAGDKSAFNIDSNTPEVSHTTSIVEYPNSSLKQNRNYQVGVVLSDKFGRQSSVVLSDSSEFLQEDFKASTIYTKYRNPALPQADTPAAAWPGESLKVLFNSTIGPENPDPTTGWPGLYSSTNPLGWYSYKIVVKQTEQDYYNIYAPGTLASYPGTSLNYGGLSKEQGFTSHAVLLSDNINKVPRDLSQVGPDQKQYRSSVKLFGRVENLNSSGTLSNEQFYPSNNPFSVSNISLENDLFPDLNTDATNGIVFYQYESNPSIARITTDSSFGVEFNPNVTYEGVNLTIFETEPTISRLDIYWETSTSGLIEDLNNAILEGTTLIKDFNGWNFTLEEKDPLNTNIIDGGYFYPVDFGDGGISSYKFSNIICNNKRFSRCNW